MILFLDTNNLAAQVVPYKEMSSIRCYEVSFRNKSLVDPDMLDDITSFMDALSYKETQYLLVINDLDDAFINLGDLDEYTSASYVAKFKMLITQLIEAGHEVVYYTRKGNPGNNDIQELNQMDGFEIIEDEIKLHNKLISNVQ